MNIKSRIEKLENQRGPAGKQIAWDFSKTSDEQLNKLHRLYKTNRPDGERYARRLIEAGFLKRAA